MAYSGLMVRTGRLSLLPACEDDRYFFENLWSDPAVCQGFGLAGPRPPEEVRLHLTEAERHWQRHGFGLFSIFVRNSGEWAGFCELEVLQNPPAGLNLPQPVVELAFAVLMRHWQKRYATEAARAMLRFGFETAGIPLIFGATGENNLASQRVMRLAGLRSIAERPFYPPCPHFWLRREEYLPVGDEYACFR